MSSCFITIGWKGRPLLHGDFLLKGTLNCGAVGKAPEEGKHLVSIEEAGDLQECPREMRLEESSG